MPWSTISQPLVLPNAPASQRQKKQETHARLPVEILAKSCWIALFEGLEVNSLTVKWNHFYCFTSPTTSAQLTAHDLQSERHESYERNRHGEQSVEIGPWETGNTNQTLWQGLESRTVYLQNHLRGLGLVLICTKEPAPPCSSELLLSSLDGDVSCILQACPGVQNGTCWSYLAP